MKIFYSERTMVYYKNRVEAVNEVAASVHSYPGLGPATVLEVDIGIMKKQDIIDLLNGKYIHILGNDDESERTVAKIWLEGTGDDVIVACREESQVGTVYRNIEVK